MALPRAAEIGLKIYDIDDNTLALRSQIWAVLESHMPAIVGGYISISVEYTPYYRDTIGKNAKRIEQLICDHTKWLFTESFDEKWIARTKERVLAEIELGYDMRNRGVITRCILSFLSQELQKRWFAGKSKSLKLMDAAMRILTLDVTNATILHHYDVQAKAARVQRDQFETAIRDFRSSVDDVRRTLDRGVLAFNETATDLTNFAKQASAQRDNAAKAADNAVLYVGHIASATEELNVSIEEIRQQAGNGANVAHEAVASADEAGATIRSLSDIVSEIGDVLGLISGIATHTNLLALNAAIEAARAGEAGKGFSIVAAEVKSLANQTSKATEEIARQVAIIEDRTRRSVEAIDGTCKTISSIAAIAEAVSSAVTQQASATANIAAGAADASSNANTVTEALSTVGTTINQTQTAAASVMGFSTELSRRTAKINDAIDTLLKVAAESGASKKMVDLVSSEPSTRPAASARG